MLIIIGAGLLTGATSVLVNAKEKSDLVISAIFITLGIACVIVGFTSL